MAFLTMEVPTRHARTRAITRDTVFPANRLGPDPGDASRGVVRVASDVSVLCPRAVDETDNCPGRSASIRAESDERRVSLCKRLCGLLVLMLRRVHLGAAQKKGRPGGAAGREHPAVGERRQAEGHARGRH
jgi:hypothetical protein